MCEECERTLARKVMGRVKIDEGWVVVGFEMNILEEQREKDRSCTMKALERRAEVRRDDRDDDDSQSSDAGVVKRQPFR